MSIAALMVLPVLMTAPMQEVQMPVPDLHPNLQRRIDAGETLRTPGEEETDEIVCRRERAIGSNRFQRVCTTQAALDRRRNALQRDLERNVDWKREDDGGQNYFVRNRVAGN